MYKSVYTEVSENLPGKKSDTFEDNVAKFTTENMENIGQRIKQLRKMLGLTQKEFAEKIGKSTISIAKWEAGDRTPDESTLKLIAKEFNIDEEWLKTGEGEMFAGVPDANFPNTQPLERLIESINKIEKVPSVVERILRNYYEKKDIEEFTNILAEVIEELKPKSNIDIGNVENSQIIKAEKIDEITYKKGK